MIRPIKIAIADDHEIVLDGLKSILNPGKSETEDGTSETLSSGTVHYDRYPFQIVAIARSGEDLLDRLPAMKQADILILDYAMGGMNGLETAVRVKAELPHLKVILFSMYESDALIKDAFACNVEGYVTKGEGRQRLLDVIKRVHKGEKMYPQLKNPHAGSPLPGLAKRAELPLSKREREIVCAIVDGASTDEISKKLNIAFNTVEVHRSNIYRKLNIKKATDLVKIALENNLCKD